MRVRLLTGAITSIAAAALAAFVLPAGSQAFSPVTYGLSLPATVSASSPARILTTSHDATGRPVFTVQVAESKAQAAEFVAAAKKKAGTVAVEVDGRVHALGAPVVDDPYAVHQWDLQKMDVATAWETSTAQGVRVAVIDTGVDYYHPDLYDNVLTGFDAIEDVQSNTTDGNGHGTHVAGTIAARAGNGVGVAGFAPEAMILPVKVLGADGSGYTSDTAEGIVWAADNHAHVINMSLGSSTPSAAVKAAVDYAHGKGVTIVAAAGNERQDGSPVSYPAAYDGVIAVAATDDRDEVAAFSNAGDYVDVAAPGAGIMSTYPAELSEDGSGYTELSGTSMAAPHVAAVAALLLGSDYDLSPERVQEVLEESAVDLGDSGRDEDFGAGRVDAGAAIAALNGGGTTPWPEVTTDVEEKTVGYGTRATTTFTVASDGEPVAGADARVCVTPVGGKHKCQNVTTDEDGEYVHTATATGSYGVYFEAVMGENMDGPYAEAAYTVQATAKLARAGKGTLVVKAGGSAKQEMTLQKKAGNGWKILMVFPVKPTTKITGLSGGAYRVVIPDSKTVLGVKSGTIKL